MIILIASLCGIGWIHKITSYGGIMSWLPAKMYYVLPERVFYPMFECAACNSFWWSLLINSILYSSAQLTLLEFFIYPAATVGLTTIIEYATAINRGS